MTRIGIRITLLEQIRIDNIFAFDVGFAEDFDGLIDLSILLKERTITLIRN